jgi:hypothetical protein
LAIAALLRIGESSIAECTAYVNIIIHTYKKRDKLEAQGEALGKSGLSAFPL